MRRISTVLVVVLAAGVVAADEWPALRGPDATGVGESGTGLPSAWSADRNIAWKVRVPGRAWSSPIVWGDRVFVTTAVTDAELEEARRGLYFGGDRPEPPDAIYEYQVRCYALDGGELLWERTASRGKPTGGHHLKNTYASETPVTDGEHVWAYFGSAGLYCYTVEGEPVWERQLGPFEMRQGWGTASSPVVDDERLYIQADQEGQSFVVALDKLTGEPVWRADRDEGSNWSTPFLWSTPGRYEVVTCGTDRVRSYDAASGELLWELGGMSSIVIPTPFEANGLLYIASGYVGDPQNRPIFAIRPGARGDITLAPGETSNDSIAWYRRLDGPYNPTPIVYGDYLYVLYDLGIFACFDARTGGRIYRQRLEASGQFTTSPWAYDGRVFCMNESGTTYVIKAGPEFEMLGENVLEEMFMASPAMARGTLVLRGADHLYAVRGE